MKASIVYVLVALGLCSFVLLCNHQQSSVTWGHRRHGPGLRIVVRKPNKSASAHVTAAFDPLVGEMEWKRENRQWERQYFQEQYKQWSSSNNASDEQHAPGHEQQPEAWDDDRGDRDFEDQEAYLNDEDRFNISQRLAIIFPQLDVNPKDGSVSLAELQDWLVSQGEKLANQRVKREFEVRDKNHDGLISFEEYLPHLSAEDFGNKTGSMEHGQAGWWKEHYDLADANGDGGLNETEFRDFLHPEDSHNPNLHAWLRKEQIRDNDQDKDEKLNLIEFDHVYDVVKYYGADLAHLHQGNDAESRKEVFKELDKNNDGYLTEDELEPIMGKLHPSESFYSKQQAQYLMEQADDDKDGLLSLREMLEHPYVFYSTAYSGDDYNDVYHDEFR